MAEKLSGNLTDQTDLKNALDLKQNLIEDTGWLPLPLGSGVTGYSWASPVYRKIGNIISVQGVVKASSLSSGSTTICTLPYGSKTEYGIGLRTGNGIQPFSLRPNGVLFPNYNATNADIWLSFTYMIA